MDTQGKRPTRGKREQPVRILRCERKLNLARNFPDSFPLLFTLYGMHGVIVIMLYFTEMAKFESLFLFSICILAMWRRYAILSTPRTRKETPASQGDLISHVSRNAQDGRQRI